MRPSMSFKRKPKPPAPSGLSLPKFLSVPLSATGRQSSPSHSPLPTRAQHRRNRSASAAPDLDGSFGSPHRYYDHDDGDNTLGGANVDWHVEGPGHRVGYDDMTAIDWIFEYAKERQRLRLLYSSASGVLAHVKQLADASQIWIVLILTGLASGWIAAFIDVASDWLGDLKTGYCRNEGGDGRFYLNKVFCCWGYDGAWLSACGDTLLTGRSAGAVLRLASVELGPWSCLERRQLCRRIFFLCAFIGRWFGNKSSPC